MSLNLASILQLSDAQCTTDIGAAVSSICGERGSNNSDAIMSPTNSSLAGFSGNLAALNHSGRSDDQLIFRGDAKNDQDDEASGRDDEHDGEVRSVAFGNAASKFDDDLKSDYDVDQHFLEERDSLSAMAQQASDSVAPTSSGLSIATSHYFLDAERDDHDDGDGEILPPFSAAAAYDQRMFEPQNVDHQQVVEAARRHLMEQNQPPEKVRQVPTTATSATVVVHNSQGLIELFRPVAVAAEGSAAAKSNNNQSDLISNEDDPGLLSSLRLEALVGGREDSNEQQQQQQQQQQPQQHHDEQSVLSCASGNNNDEETLLIRVLYHRTGTGAGGGANSEGSEETDGNVTAVLSQEQAEHVGRLIRRDFELFREALARQPSVAEVIMHHDHDG